MSLTAMGKSIIIGFGIQGGKMQNKVYSPLLKDAEEALRRIYGEKIRVQNLWAKICLEIGRRRARKMYLKASLANTKWSNEISPLQNTLEKEIEGCERDLKTIEAQRNHLNNMMKQLSLFETIILQGNLSRVRKQLWKLLEAEHIEEPKETESQNGLRERELNWAKEHSEELDKFSGQWIVIEKDKIISHGQELLAIVQEARESGIKSPFVIRVSSKDEGPLIV